MNSVNTVEPDDFLFWQEIRKAYDQVATNNERRITFTHSGREAQVYCENEVIAILICEVEDSLQHEERLIAP